MGTRPYPGFWSGSAAAANKRCSVMTAPRLTGSRCLCRRCGEYFNSAYTFDRYRIWDSPTARRCLTVDEMVGTGMSVNSAGFWITEPHRKHRAQPAASQIPAALWKTPLGHQGGAL